MPDFPPLLRGVAAEAPREAAVAAASEGCAPGTVFWAPGADLDSAVVLAPEVGRARAAQMLPLGAVALRDAIGALGPEALPVHLTWDGRIMLDGGEAGRVRAVAPPGGGVPDWLVVHAALRLLPEARPEGERTALWAEGAGDVTADALVSAWSRHMLHRLSQWEDGPHALHAECLAASWERRAGDAGYVGLDEGLGRLRRDGGAVRLDPLEPLLEAP